MIRWSRLKEKLISIGYKGVDYLSHATTCTSSGIPLEDKRSTSFPCPGHDTDGNPCKSMIGRSEMCRNQGVRYICPECRFVGP